MKRFLPYLSLLLPLKWKFIAGVLAGAVAAFASGFGLPFMTREVFPLIFSSEETGKVAESPVWMKSIIEWLGNGLGFSFGSDCICLLSAACRFCCAGCFWLHQRLFSQLVWLEGFRSYSNEGF